MRAIFYTPKPSQIKRFVYSTNKMFIYNSSVLDVFLLVHVAQFFLQLNLASHIFFSQAGLASHRQASPHAGGASPHTGRPHTGRPSSHRGPSSHREAPPHTGRPPLTQRGPPLTQRAHTGKPHADTLSFRGRPHLKQANFTQAGLVSHVCSKKKQTNELREENPKPLGV